MPFGSFLDSLPQILFVAAHVAFLLVGLWAATRRTEAGTAWRMAVFALYAISQVGFLAFFGGVITLKMAVLLEQMLMVIVVLALATRAGTASALR
jgi:uncharacterized membrane protein